MPSSIRPPGQEGEGGPARHQAGAPERPNLVKREVKTSLSLIRSCTCGSNWCHSCWLRRGVKKLMGKFQRLDWKRVRFLTLTINPELFPDAVDAFLFIQKKSKIAQFIRDLDRYMGVRTVDWVWVMEFMHNTFPHWHMLVDVGVEGRDGMISGDVLRQCWKYGRINETFISSEKGWGRLTGYFGKNGLFREGRLSSRRVAGVGLRSRPEDQAQPVQAEVSAGWGQEAGSLPA